MSHREEKTSDRSQAMASALATFFKQVGLTLSGKTSLERCQSFVAKDKKSFAKSFSKANKRFLVVREHTFQPQHYYTVTNCNHCSGIIWGIGYQGYQCSSE